MEQMPPGMFDLRDAPMPRFDLLDPEKYNRITVQTSRGCPHRCEFCASSVLLTPRYKLKPVEKVLGEIHAIKRLWSRPFIEFADDNSFVHVDHYKRLLRALVPEGLRWFTEADVRVAEDDELLSLMGYHVTPHSVGRVGDWLDPLSVARGGFAFVRNSQ